MKFATSRLLTATVFLIFSTSVLAQNVTRGPYLQSVNDAGVVVRWRTDVATDSYVRYGTSAGSLNQTASVSGSRTEHVVTLAGLSSLTKYYYSVGTSTGQIEGNSSYHFNTSPAPGVAAPTRIWVLGDSGTANTHPGLPEAVRDAFVAYSAASPADLMVMLGDNAYPDGTDSQYQDAVFDTYPVQLRQLPLWLTLGNHDGHSADSSTQTGPYYDMFTLPTAGEFGGLASGTEAYYSFDHGNIHFISLNSYDVDKSVNGNMMQWLEGDLAFNDKPWVIAIWHHPPYTKGSHNSDTSSAETAMRQNALPILEAWGVDLVLGGHSHSYERSYLLDGHYGVSTTLDPVSMVLNPGDGKELGDGVYEKPDISAAEHEGAVYVVAGSSGKVSNAAVDHPAMYVGLIELGSMVIDVSGNRLDAVFIDDNGNVDDEFTIMKTPDIQPPLIDDVTAEDGTHVVVDYSERVDSLTAGTTGNYSIPGLTISNAAVLAGSKSVRLTTSAMTPNQSYVLTINNVMDENGNVIVPNSQFGFDFIQMITISFQDGLAPDPTYAGTMDSYIREATATTNYGSATTIQVDGDEPSGSGTDMSIVLAWDINEIPATATIQSASIHFNVLNVGGTYYCYELVRAWNEGQVTWNNADSGNAWQSGGAEGAADRNNTALCSINSGSLGQLEVPLNNDGLAVLQSWVSGATANHGFLIGDASSSNGLDMDSSESASAMDRPMLEVVYSVPAVPPNQPPTAAFSDSCTDLDCSFTDSSSDSDGSIVNWSWDFGDGNGSSAQSPAYSYAAAGSYTVELTVTDNEGAMDVTSKLVTVSAPNQPPTAAFSDSCTDLDCNFTDASSDSDGSIVNWSWDFGDGNGSSAQNPAYSYALAGSYTVELTVTDDQGDSDIASTLVTVTAPPLVVEVMANAQILGSGTVSGGFTNTHDDDGNSQSITERESGGRKSNRYSFLVHTWVFDLPVNAMATVNANAWSGGSTDDAFKFSWSSNNSSYTEMFSVSDTGSANAESFILPPGTSGTVYIRVEDTDQSPGNRTLDTVFIDHLYVLAESGAGGGDPPDAPSVLSATATGSSTISLAWTDNATDESGFRIERSLDGSSFSQIGTASADATGFNDSGLSGGVTYWYRVYAFNLYGDSGNSNVDSATTDPAPAISLSLNGYKIKGKHNIDLSWSGTGGGNVDILRDGNPLATVSDSGAYTDSTSNKGGRTYTYQVCDAGTADCSAVESVTF